MIQNLKTLKENKDIKYIYKIPCSYIKDGFLYIIVGTMAPVECEEVILFTLDEWFDKMQKGDLLMYACATLPKKYRIKEHLNIYTRPDLLQFRRYILTEKLCDLLLCLETN